MKSVLILIFLMLSMNVPAGVRVVSGGGFAEMQAYAMDKALPLLVRACLQQPMACLLTELEKNLLQKLTRSNNIFNSLIIINTTCNEPYIHASPASLDACALYNQDNSVFGLHPKSTAEIAKLVLRVRLLQVDEAQAESSVSLFLVEKLFNGLLSENKPVLIPLSSKHYRLHVWSWSLSEHFQSSLVLEDWEHSFDLTEELIQTLECTNSTFSWHLEDIVVSHRENSKSEVNSTILWNCGDTKYRARLNLLVFQKGAEPEVQFSLFAQDIDQNR